VRRTSFLAALALLVAIAQPAAALPPEEPKWEIRPYFNLWAASLYAEVEVAGIHTEQDIKFRDILSDLGWAIMGGVETRYDRFLFLVDVLGMQTVSDVTGSPRSRPFTGALGRPGELQVGGFDVHTRLTQWALDVKPGFRVWSHKLHEAPDDPRRLDLDLFAGFRYWNVTNKTGIEIDPAQLTVDGNVVDIGDLGDRFPLRGDVRVPGRLLRGTDKSVQNTIDWFDPILGMRVGADLKERWRVFLAGDFGGFNIGSASEFTWQAMLGSQFALSDRWILQSGYRALGVEQETGLENTIMHGPQLTVMFRFY